MTTFILILLVCLLIAAGYVIFNLLRKLERAEDYAETLASDVAASLVSMRIVDQNGAFEADDEVGDVFKMLLRIVENLNKTIK